MACASRGPFFWDFMALSPNINSREFDKFRDGNKVAVTVEGDIGLLEGIKYDSIEATYPSLTTELYTYKLATVAQAQILVTYSDSTKEIFLSAVKT